jgi:mannose-6-phosphate isomerase-like protein (cupin superfamily)
MEIVRCWEEKGETIPEPYKRTIKVFFAPDKRGVPELTFTQAIIFPHSKTDYHTHDRPELIFIVSGRGTSVCDGKETPIQQDMALWVKAGEKHQVINTESESLKLATVFIPPYTSKELLGYIKHAAERDKEKK